MILRTRWASFWLLLLAVSVLLPVMQPASAAESQEFSNPAVAARLISAEDGIAPDAASVSLGLALEYGDGWKGYWRTPGEVGLAPEIDWTGSSNLKSAEIRPTTDLNGGGDGTSSPADAQAKLDEVFQEHKARVLNEQGPEAEDISTPAEKVRGQYNWNDDLDLIHFIELAQSLNLNVVVRIGPYICGEYYFGGLPLWLRHTGAQCFRCSDPVWKYLVQEWMQIVIEKLEPYLAPNGGPIIMLQTDTARGSSM